MRLLRVASTALYVTCAATAQILISSVTVEGNQRLSTAAIVQSTGLKTGQTVARTDLDAAAQKLFETGLFTSMNYRYAQVAGKEPQQFTVTLVLKEERADTPLRIDIAGMDEDKLWTEMRAVEPLTDRRTPHNERALDLLCRALERALQRSGRNEKIVTVPSADLKTGKMETALVLANAPTVSEVRFAGNQAIGAAALVQAVGHLINGNRYAEREFRQILALNARPLYENRGFLKVEFGELRLSFGAGVVAVTVPVAEGRAWTLGKVELAGDGVPAAEMHQAGKFAEGKVADWSQVLRSIDAANRVLLADGYLGVRSNPVRVFRDDGVTVDVRVDVTRGRQFHFGAIDASGLGADLEAKALMIWKLKTGDPFNQPYTLEFLKALYDIAPKATKIQTSMKPRGDQTTLDLFYAIAP